MKDFLKNVLANIVAILLLGGLLVFFFIMMLVASAFGDSGKAVVKNDSVLTLDAKTIIIDSPTEADEEVFNFGKKQKYVTLYNVLEAIKHAKTDDKIKGISIENDFLNAGLTQIDDIRAALTDFKKSGKFVYAYGNTVSQPSYLLGSVADQYFLNPAGGIELKGMAKEVTFYKALAEKYGVGIQVIRHGKYKAAVEPLLRNDISPENKEQLSTLLGDIWGNAAQKIAVSRKIDTAQFKTIVDSLYGIIPTNAPKYKLADKLAQKGEYEDMLKTKLGVKKDKDLNRISFSKYIKSFKDDEVSGDEVAVLYASGNIMPGDDYNDIHSEAYIEEIRKLQNDDDVKAVVLRVNSPGGSANAADEILFELQQLKAKKPLVVSFGDYAASGGYYIAMAGDKIFSEPNTLTGSIGVFGTVPNFKGLAEKNGVRSDVVQTNANANFYSAINGLSPGALSMMTKNVEQTYRRFVGFVMQNRKKSFEEIDAVGGGRVWSGTRAKQIGLVDELGTLQDAINAAAKKAGVKDYEVVSYPKKRSKFEQLFKDMDEDEISAKLIKLKIGKENFRIFEMLTDESKKSQVMMQMPYSVSYK